MSVNTESPRLHRRIAELGLSPDVRLTFVAGLQELAAVTEGSGLTALAMIRRLVEPPYESDQGAAPFEALWPYAHEFITACIYVAVTDGQYSVEEARQVSLFAHRLGMSAGQLASLEARVFEDLKMRGAARLARERLKQASS